MPIPEDCVRTSITWNLPQGEIAVNTINFQHVHQPGNTLDWDNDMTQRYANLVRDALESQWGSMAVAFANTISVRSIDAYHLGTDGKALNKKTALPTSGTSLKGTSGAGPLPLECAVVVSLYGYGANEYVPNGAQKRGRIYLPGIQNGWIDSFGRLTQTQLLVDSWKNVISYMANRKMDALPVSSERARPVVLSRTHGTATDIKSVRVDDLVDTQRRRQNALIPNVKWATVVPQS